MYTGSVEMRDLGKWRVLEHMLHDSFLLQGNIDSVYIGKVHEWHVPLTH